MKILYTLLLHLHDIVLQLPAVRPVITVPPKDQAAKKGETVVFTCMAIGIPEPKIEWYFRDTQKVERIKQLL